MLDTHDFLTFMYPAVLIRGSVYFFCSESDKLFFSVVVISFFIFLLVHFVKVLVAHMTTINSATKRNCEDSISTVRVRKVQPAIYFIEIRASITQQ